MNAIPWYRSQVFISGVVAVLSGIAAACGKADVFSQEKISAFVEAVGSVIGIGAGVWTMVARGRATAQPLAISKASAEAQNAAAAPPAA